MDNKISGQEKVLLIGVISQTNNESIVEEHIQELCLLVKTAGAEVVGVITQKVSKINPATLIGAGKAKQIISQAEEIGAKIIIFDDELSPAQIKNYHKMSKNIKILDRNGLILDIFKKQKAIITSMTKKEKVFPDIIKASRKNRICKGSGSSIQDINKLLKQFKKMSQMMKKMGKDRNIQNMMKTGQFNNLDKMIDTNKFRN